MSEIKLTVGVEVTQKDDGKYYFNLLAENHVTIESIRSILAGGLVLSILAEKTPEAQAKAMKETLDYMNNEFISTDTFAESVDLENPDEPNE